MKKGKLTAKRMNEIFNGIEELFGKGCGITSLYAYRVGGEVYIDLHESFCRKTKGKKEKR